MPTLGPAANAAPVRIDVCSSRPSGMAACRPHSRPTTTTKNSLDFTLLLTTQVHLRWQTTTTSAYAPSRMKLSFSPRLLCLTNDADDDNKRCRAVHLDDETGLCVAYLIRPHHSLSSHSDRYAPGVHLCNNNDPPELDADTIGFLRTERICWPSRILIAGPRCTGRRAERFS